MPVSSRLRFRSFGCSTCRRLCDSNWRVSAGRALAGLHDLLHRRVVRVRLGDGIQQNLAIAVDDGQQVIEIVRDASGQHAHRFHFGGLPELFFEPIALGHILEHGEHRQPAAVGD